jgi:hypothetical protein
MTKIIETDVREIFKCITFNAALIICLIGMLEESGTIMAYGAILLFLRESYDLRKCIKEMNKNG